MLSALATLIDCRPWWVLAIGIHVRDDLRQRGFDVAGIRLDTKDSVGG
jgi:hypothetical protein